MNTCYRLYTEIRPNLQALVSSHFEGATIFYAEGLWQGKPEQSAIIEIVGSVEDLARVRSLALLIRITNDQTTVMLTMTAVNVQMIGD